MLDNLIAETLPASPDGSLRPYRFDWSSDLKFPLYKATSRKWFDNLQATGEIYLNTFYNLAAEENFGRGVGDRNEGSRELHYINGSAFKYPVTCRVHAVNSWLFCCASKVDQKLIETWGAEVVYEITSIEFFVAITQQVRNISEFCIVAPVSYGEWLDHGPGTDRVKCWMDENNTPGCDESTLNWPSVAYMKDHDLAYQHEVRATWEPPFDRREQRFEERFGRESAAERNAWDNGRVKILRERGVRADLQAIPLRVPGIQRFIKEIPINEIE